MDLDKNIRDVDHLKDLVNKYKANVDRLTKNAAAYRKKYYNGEVDISVYNQMLDMLRGAQKLYLSTIFQLELAKCSLEMLKF